MSKSCFLCCIGPRSSKTSDGCTTSRADVVPDTVELATGLNAHDRTLIKETGEIIFSQLHLQNKGVTFLIAFFKKYPHHQRYFKMFRGIPPEELKSIPHTENHGRRVMNQMALLVQHLEEPVLIKQQLYDLITKHNPRHVKPRQMKDMLNMFVVFTGQQLGSKFTAQHEAAWKKMTSHMLAVLEEASHQYPNGRLSSADNGRVAHAKNRTLERSEDRDKYTAVSRINNDEDDDEEDEMEIIKQGSEENVNESGVDPVGVSFDSFGTKQ